MGEQDHTARRTGPGVQNLADPGLYTPGGTHFHARASSSHLTLQPIITRMAFGASKSPAIQGCSAARSAAAACRGSSAAQTTWLTAMRRAPAATTSATLAGVMPPRAKAGSAVSAAT